MNLKNILEEVSEEFDKEFPDIIGTTAKKSYMRDILYKEDLKFFITHHITEAVKVALGEISIEKEIVNFYPEGIEGDQSKAKYRNEAIDEIEAKKKEFLNV